MFIWSHLRMLTEEYMNNAFEWHWSEWNQTKSIKCDEAGFSSEIIPPNFVNEVIRNALESVLILITQFSFTNLRERVAFELLRQHWMIHYKKHFSCKKNFSRRKHFSYRKNFSCKVEIIGWFMWADIVNVTRQRVTATNKELQRQRRINQNPTRSLCSFLLFSQTNHFDLHLHGIHNVDQKCSSSFSRRSWFFLLYFFVNHKRARTNNTRHFVSKCYGCAGG